MRVCIVALPAACSRPAYSAQKIISWLSVNGSAGKSSVPAFAPASFPSPGSSVSPPGLVPAREGTIRLGTLLHFEATGLSEGFSAGAAGSGIFVAGGGRSEEHTSELQSLMRISYAVFCLKKKNNTTTIKVHHNDTHKRL